MIMQTKINQALQLVHKHLQMPQLILYTLRVLLLAFALATLGIHYLLHPLSKPIVLLLYGTILMVIFLTSFKIKRPIQ